MYSYKLLIAYDGTAYHGWQFQPGVPTIAGLLEKRFKDVFKKEITLVGASRTDAGVHALGQVARFKLDSNIPAEKLFFGWKNALPSDILIRSLTESPESFHPQNAVVEKTYYYHFFQKRPLPFVTRYGYFLKDIDIEKLKAGLEFFVGTHDFRSFCTGYDAECTLRTINSIELHYYKRFGIYQIRIYGPSFLRHMIRRIVGACLDVALHKDKSLDLLKCALAEKNPLQHLFVAPAQGLLLHSIKYQE